MKNKKINIASFPFFYGYIILFGGTVGALMSAPGQTVGVSVFTDYLIEAHNITRDNLSLAYLIGTLGSAFVLTYAGKFFDKYGARVTSTLAGIMLGLALIFISEVGFIADLFSDNSSESRSTIIFVLLVLAFFTVRFSGQGVLTMASRNMVMKWFEKRRGMASAFMGISISFGFSYSPVVFDSLINQYGWQETWQYIAIAVGIFFSLFAYLIFRDNPQEYNLIPDGKEVKHKGKNAPKYKAEKDFTLKEARATFSFWIFNLTLALQGLYITALTFNVVDIFTGAGLTREDAILIFLPASIIAVVFQISSGYLADYIKLKYLLMVQLSGIIIASIGLSLLQQGFPVYLIIIGNGISGGLFGVVSSVTWPRFYGTKNLGAISGFNMSWIVAGSAVGPYMFSVLHTFTKSYSVPGIICLCSAVILFVLALKADNVNE